MKAAENTPHAAMPFFLSFFLGGGKETFSFSHGLQQLSLNSLALVGSERGKMRENIAIQREPGHFLSLNQTSLPPSVPTA